METATNATIDPTIAMAEVIAENFCKQIIAFQNAITNREPGLQFPSPQEINLLCKLVSCLAKIKRLAAPIQQNKAIKSFVSFLAKDNKELGKTVNQKYKEYIKEEPANNPPTDEVQTTTDNDIPVDSSPNNAVEVTPTAPRKLPFITSIHRKYKLRFDVPLEEIAITPPVTESEFLKYEYLLFRLKEPRNHQTLFREDMCNTNWLQYNLFQFNLPVEDRNFIANEKNYHNIINHYGVAAKMEKYIIAHKLG